MPLRREGDRVEEIESFDSWVEKTLSEAIARGEFDNLPQAGKPIRIERNPYQPELDLAYSRLKNANMAPAWIELDREARAMHEALDRWLQAAAGRLAAEATRIRRLEETPLADPPDTDRQWFRRWWPFRLFAKSATHGAASDPETEWRRWEYERRIVREQYLERAAQRRQNPALQQLGAARSVASGEGAIPAGAGGSEIGHGMSTEVGTPIWYTMMNRI